MVAGDKYRKYFQASKTQPVTDILKVDFFCAVKTSVLKFCARKSAKVTPKITYYV